MRTLSSIVSYDTRRDTSNRSIDPIEGLAIDFENMVTGEESFSKILLSGEIISRICLWPTNISERIFRRDKYRSEYERG